MTPSLSPASSYRLLAAAAVFLLAAQPDSPNSRAARATPAAGETVGESGQVERSDWPMWGQTPSRNNVAEANIPADWVIPERWSRRPEDLVSRNVKWIADLGSQCYGNPVVANGHVYVGTNNANGYVPRFPALRGNRGVDLGVLLCFDEETGDFLWQHSSPKLPGGLVHDWPDTGICSSPVVEGDRLWLVTNRCEVLCLDTQGFHDQENDGPVRDEPNENRDESDIIWSLDMIRELGVWPHNMSTCSPLIVDETLFVCTSNGVNETHVQVPAPNAPSFLAMNRNTGEILWSDNSPGANILHGQWASPSYGVFDGQPQVLFPGGDGWLYSFDPAGDGHGNSRLLWKFDANPKTARYSLRGRSPRNPLVGFAVIDDGRIYVAVGEDPQHGDADGHLWCLAPGAVADGRDVSSELAVSSEGRIIPHRRIQAVVVEAGEKAIPNPHSAVVWHYTGGDVNGDGRLDFEEGMHRSIGSPVIKDGILYICDFAGILHCLNARTGEPHWTYDHYSQCWGTVLVVDGRVYLGTEVGELLVLRHSSDRKVALPDGKPLAVMDMANSIFMTPVVSNNVLFVANKNTLYAIANEQTPGEKRTP